MAWISVRIVRAPGSPLAPAALTALAAAITVGCSVDQGGAAPVSDAAPVIYDARLPDATPDYDAVPACIDAVPEVAQTGHHAERYDYTEGGGAGCLGQCHNGTLGETYTAAGAIYNRRIAGGDPVAGAHVYVIDANGKVVEMISARNGFFWTNRSLTAPIRAYASACPDSMPMIANASGNCNSAGCHPESAKIYLPNAL